MKNIIIILLMIFFLPSIQAQTVHKVNPLIYGINKSKKPSHQISLGYNILQGSNIEGVYHINNRIGFFGSIGYSHFKITNNEGVRSPYSGSSVQQNTLISAGISSVYPIHRGSQIFEWQAGLSVGKYFYQENHQVSPDISNGTRWEVSEQTAFAAIKMHWLRRNGDFYAGLRADLSQNPVLIANSYAYGEEKDFSGLTLPSIGPLLGYQYEKNRLTWGFQAGIYFREHKSFSYSHKTETSFSAGTQTIQGVTGTLQFKMGYIIKS